MKVYVVIADFVYADGYLVGVFADKEKARIAKVKKVVELRQNGFNTGYFTVSVKESEVVE